MIKKLWYKYKYNQSLNKINRLEQQIRFILIPTKSVFFPGETASKIALEKWNKDMTDTKLQLKKYEKLMNIKK